MTEEEFAPNQKPLDRYLVKLTTGELISLTEFLEMRKETPEAEMSMTGLKPGDIVLMQHFNDAEMPEGFSFQITETEWSDFGFASARPTVRGKLSGITIPEEEDLENVFFIGSGMGGSSVYARYLITGQRPYFGVPRRGELHLPEISTFEIFRPNQEGILEPIEPQAVDEANRKPNQQHARRLGFAAKLMGELGFNFNLNDFEARTAEDVSKETDTYIAGYDASGAQGNSLTIYDKRAKEWLRILYQNWGGEDILQITVSELGQKEYSKVFDGGFTGYREALWGSPLYRAGLNITTHASSRRYGLDVVDVRLSTEQTRALDLPQPDLPNRGKIRPHIQLWADGQIKVSDEDHAIPKQSILSKISIDKSRQAIDISDEHIDLPDFDREMLRALDLVKN